MGVVFLARDPEALALTDRSSASGLVALKVPRPELAASPRALERFLGEARRMQQFSHPHIVPVLEIGSSPGRPYLVMPHLRHGNLWARIRRHGPLSESEAVRLGCQIASALLYAHGLGVIHHDLNPANVLLDDRGNAVLTDFGLARTVFYDGVDGLRSERPEGTAPYMSPAVARGEAEDTRCDIYGIGALLYEALTGYPPYAGSSSEEILGQIQAGPPPAVRARNPEASARLAEVVTWAMARELRHRYAHMVDVLSDLQRIEAGLAPCGPRGPVQVQTSAADRSRLLNQRLAVFAALALSIASLGLVFPAWTKSPGQLRGLRFTAEGNGTPARGSPEVSEWLMVHEGHLLLLDARSGTRVEVVRRLPIPEDWNDPALASTPPLHARVDLIADLDGDNLDEMLVRAGDPATGILPFIACYSVGTGSLHWARHNVRGFQRPTLVDLEGDGVTEIFVTARTGTSEGYETVLLSRHGEPLHITHLPDRVLSWHPCPRERGEGRELVVLDASAQCHALDHQLRRTRSLPIEIPTR